MSFCWAFSASLGTAAGTIPFDGGTLSIEEAVRTTTTARAHAAHGLWGEQKSNFEARGLRRDGPGGPSSSSSSSLSGPRYGGWAWAVVVDAGPL